MLKRVEIKDFRSCHGVLLDNLGPMTVLVGRNAVGKTNILRAIHWVAYTATSGKVPQAPNQSADVTLEAAIDGTTYRYALRIQVAAGLPGGQPFTAHFFESLDYSGDGHAVRVFERNGDVVTLSPSGMRVILGEFVPCMPALASQMAADSPVASRIRHFLLVLNRIRYYPLDMDAGDGFIFGLVNQSGYNEWLTKYRGTDDPGTSVLKRLLHLWLTNDPRFEEIRSLLGPNGLGLVDRIDLHPFEPPKSTDLKEETNKWYWLEFQPSSQSQRFGFADLAAGTQRVIRLLVSLIFDQSAVMLVEHPEDTIHRGLLRKLIDVLRTYSDQSQLILSSHSSVVFNTLDPKAIRLVTMEDGNTKVRPLTNDELSAAGRFMEEDGSLADFIETVEEE